MTTRRKYYYLSVDYEESLEGYEYIKNPFNIDLSGSDWLSVLDSINIEKITSLNEKEIDLIKNLAIKGNNSKFMSK